MRALWVIALLVLSSAAMGCSCSDGSGPTGDSGVRPDSPGVHCNDECVAAMPPGSPMGQQCCESTQMCVDYNVNDLCMPGFTCPAAMIMMDASCHVTCGRCMERPPLNPGYLATDLDFVITSAGDQFLSGYSPGNPPSTNYGDMVVATIPGGELGMIDWDIADGAPATPITAAPSGWRGGVAAPGDNVGLWTSIASSGTQLFVSYYDATHGALRLAIGLPGDWRVQTVDDTGDAGRYSSLVLTASGAPAIAYLGYELDATTGAVHSQVRVAVASSAAPMAAADWTISRIGDAASPCRPNLCGMGQRCLESGTCVMPTGTCAPACSATQACVAGTCTAALAADYVEDLTPAHGLYTRLARTSAGLALVYYDRTEGNLYGVSATGTTWGTPFLIDGYGRSDPSTGDSGQGASIFVDAADTWHVTYVDGAEEVLRYARIVAGAITREVVDDGSTSDGTMAYTDGRHIVGDDSSVVVVGGEVRVAYQDSTTERTMIARRSAAGAWTHGVLDMGQHSGFWVEQELNTAGDQSFVASWWIDRTGTMVTNGIHVTQVPAGP